MIAALRVWWRALRHLNHRGHLYIGANILWLLLSLPIITAPAAWAGLTRLCHVALRDPSVTMEAFWLGFRENLARGAVLALINVAVIVVNVSNLTVYRYELGTGADIMRSVWLLTLIVWFGLQFYVWSLFYAMGYPTMLGAFRNAAVMALHHPVFTLTTWLLAAAVIFISSALVPSWLLLTGSVLVVAACYVVTDRLQAVGFATDARLTDDVPSDGNALSDIYG